MAKTHIAKESYKKKGVTGSPMHTANQISWSLRKDHVSVSINVIKF
jgi:hypothetical protein